MENVYRKKSRIPIVTMAPILTQLQFFAHITQVARKVLLFCTTLKKEFATCITPYILVNNRLHQLC